MSEHASMPAQSGDNPEAVELFCLEFGHQVRTTIRPAIKAKLDRKQEVFDTSLRFAAKPVQGNARSQSRTRPKGKRQRRRKRAERDRVKAKPPFIRDLAARLARHWRAPLILDARLKPAG